MNSPLRTSSSDGERPVLGSRPPGGEGGGPGQMTDPRREGRSELVGHRRRRDDGRAGLVGGPAGDGPSIGGLADLAEPGRRLGRADQRRPGPGGRARAGSLAFGQSRTVQVSPPVRVQSTDGSLEITVDGQSHGALGQTGQPAQDLFTGR